MSFSHGQVCRHAQCSDRITTANTPQTTDPAAYLLHLLGESAKATLHAWCWTSQGHELDHSAVGHLFCGECNRVNSQDAAGRVPVDQTMHLAMKETEPSFSLPQTICQYWKSWASDLLRHCRVVDMQEAVIESIVLCACTGAKCRRHFIVLLVQI